MLNNLDLPVVSDYTTIDHSFQYFAREYQKNKFALSFARYKNNYKSRILVLVPSAAEL